jgi:hypothetical protein
MNGGLLASVNHRIVLQPAALLCRTNLVSGSYKTCTVGGGQNLPDLALRTRKRYRPRAARRRPSRLTPTLGAVEKAPTRRRDLVGQAPKLVKAAAGGIVIIPHQIARKGGVDADAPLQTRHRRRRRRLCDGRKVGRQREHISGDASCAAQGEDREPGRGLHGPSIVHRAVPKNWGKKSNKTRPTTGKVRALLRFKHEREPQSAFGMPRRQFSIVLPRKAAS